MPQAIEFICPQCGRCIGVEKPGTAFWTAMYALMNGDAPTTNGRGHYCPEAPPRSSDRIIYAKPRLVTVR